MIYPTTYIFTKKVIDPGKSKADESLEEDYDDASLSLSHSLWESEEKGKPRRDLKG